LLSIYSSYTSLLLSGAGRIRYVCIISYYLYVLPPLSGDSYYNKLILLCQYLFLYFFPFSIISLYPPKKHSILSIHITIYYMPTPPTPSHIKKMIVYNKLCLV